MWLIYGSFIQGFLFVYMSEQQKQLLKRYGELLLIDATYKVIKYPFPLYQLVVKTNVDYQVSTQNYNT